MLLCLISLFLVLVSFAQSLERIVGGQEANIEDYPYQLSIRQNGKHICGGALIGEKYGLSAAHCFQYGLYTVKAGSNLKDSGGDVAYVKTVYVHPERASHRLQYDIAILELENPFTIGKHIQTVNLPENDKLIIPGTVGVISGFGDTFPSQSTGSDVLRAAEVPVVDLTGCQKSYLAYRILLTSMVFCAAKLEGGIDSCQGDSGGPFVIDNILYGIVSFGMGCGNADYPGVYTNIARYREFIRLNTGI